MALAVYYHIRNRTLTDDEIRHMDIFDEKSHPLSVRLFIFAMIQRRDLSPIVETQSQ